MNGKLRKTIAASVVASTIVLGGVGIASAQTTTTPTQPAATGNRPTPGARLATALAPLVKGGTITQAQADAIIKALADAAPSGMDRGGPRGPGGMGRGGAGHVATITRVLGVTQADLQAARTAGKSLATLAGEKGVPVQTLINALVAEAKLEHPQAPEADLIARVTAHVNGVRPAGGGPRGTNTAPANLEKVATA